MAPVETGSVEFLNSAHEPLEEFIFLINTRSHGSLDMEGQGLIVSSANAEGHREPDLLAIRWSALLNALIQPPQVEFYKASPSKKTPWRVYRSLSHRNENPEHPRSPGPLPNALQIFLRNIQGEVDRR